MRSLLFVALVLIIALSACSSLYVPNAPGAPMLRKRGELYASANAGLSGTVGLNSAYAFSDHGALMINGAFVNRDRSRKSFHQQLVETAAGYFTTFGADSNRVLEVYAGLGRGNSERITRETAIDATVFNDQYRTGLNKAFIQVNFSTKKKRAVRVFGKDHALNYGTILRLSHVEMRKFEQNGTPIPREDNIFIEPVFFTRLRLGKSVQLQYLSGSNFGLKNRRYLTAGSSVLSLGLVINAGR